MSNRRNTEALELASIKDAAADYDFWSKVAEWTYSEAAALLLGVEPDIAREISFRVEYGDDGPAKIPAARPWMYDFDRQYDRLCLLLSRSADSGQVTDQSGRGWLEIADRLEIPTDSLKSALRWPATRRTSERDMELQEAANRVAKEWRESGRRSITKEEVALALARSDEWKEMTADRIRRILRVQWK